MASIHEALKTHVSGRKRIINSKTVFKKTLITIFNFLNDSLQVAPMQPRFKILYLPKITFRSHFNMTTRAFILRCLHWTAEPRNASKSSGNVVRVTEGRNSRAGLKFAGKFTKHGCRRFLCFRLFLPSSSFILPLSPGPLALSAHTHFKPGSGREK